MTFYQNLMSAILPYIHNVCIAYSAKKIFEIMYLHIPRSYLISSLKVHQKPMHCSRPVIPDDSTDRRLLISNSLKQ